MRRVSSAFFTIAALCGLAGMVWGSYLARAKGASASDALAQARAAGLKDGPLADAAQRYISGITKDAGSK